MYRKIRKFACVRHRMQHRSHDVFVCNAAGSLAYMQRTVRQLAIYFVGKEGGLSPPNSHNLPDHVVPLVQPLLPSILEVRYAPCRL